MVAAIGAKTAVVSTSVGLAHEDLEPLASAGHAGRCVIASHFRGPRLPLLIDGPRRPELGLGHHFPDRGDTLQGVLRRHRPLVGSRRQCQRRFHGVVLGSFRSIRISSHRIG